MVAVADVVAVVVAVVEVHVERVVRVVSLARPVVVVRPTGPSLIALPLAGTVTPSVKVLHTPVRLQPSAFRPQPL